MLKIEMYETGLKEYNYAFTVCFCINMERVSLFIMMKAIKQIHKQVAFTHHHHQVLHIMHNCLCCNFMHTAVQ